MAQLLEGVAGTPGEGPYIVLRLQCEGEFVSKVDFECNGCPAAQVSCCGIVALAPGRSRDQLRHLTAPALITLVGGLPEGKSYYAEMAVEALQSALGDPNA